MPSSRTLVFSAALWLVGCGTPPIEPTPGTDGGTDAGVLPAEDAGVFAICTPAYLDTPRVATTYFIATGEPGADNDACDGLSPTNEGGGHCPFKDLNSTRTRNLLRQVKSTRVNLRAGTYVISGWEGVVVEGIGTSWTEAAVLSSYRGEHVVIDVAAPDGEGCFDAGGPGPDGGFPAQCVRDTVQLKGHFSIIQGLTVQNGLAFTAQFNGGSDFELRCNHFTVTVPVLSRSDLVKGSGESTRVKIHHNELSQWNSQAIDLAGVSDVTVELNDFHHPGIRGNGAVGAKYGARRITVRNNLVHDLDFTAPDRAALGGGGTGTTAPTAATAYDVHIVGNRVWNVKSKVARFTSCIDCSFEDNEVDGAAVGVELYDSATGSDSCDGGCLPTSGWRFTGNKLKGLTGAGDPAWENLVLAVADGEAQRLAAGDNLYCLKGSSPARVLWRGVKLTLADLVADAGIDATSTAVPETDARCTGW